VYESRSNDKLDRRSCPAANVTTVLGYEDLTLRRAVLLQVWWVPVGAALRREKGVRRP